MLLTRKKTKYFKMHLIFIWHALQLIEGLDAREDFKDNFRHSEIFAVEVSATCVKAWEGVSKI